MTEDTRHNPDLPDELRDFEASLDAQGDRLRASAPDDLGERIAAAGLEILSAPRPGEWRLAGSSAEPGPRIVWRQHWRLAASVALLVVTAIAVIGLQQQGAGPDQQAGVSPDPTDNTELATTVTTADDGLDEDWIEFETAFIADTGGDLGAGSGWSDEAFEALDGQLDALELSFNTAWTLDENLNLNEGESL